MRKTLIVVSCLFITVTALPLIREDDWWIRIFDFPRAQIAAGALVSAIVFLYFYNKKSLFENALLGILILSIIYQAYRIYPYTFLASPQTLKSESKNPDTRFSLLVSNVLMHNRNTERYLEIVRNANPDIICVLEPNKWWEERLRVLEKDYPYTTKYPLENTYGILLYSRLKLVNSQVNFLIEKNIPSTFSIVELRSDKLIELYCIHPEPPIPTEDTTSTERDAEVILVAKKARKSQKPTVVMGDFNDVAWSHTTKLFQDISGLLDPRIGRGFYNTFHAKVPLFRFPMDHAFHSSSFRLVELKRLPNAGSDHFPVFIELSYEPEGRKEQALPRPSQEDKKEAEETIEKAK